MERRQRALSFIELCGFNDIFQQIYHRLNQCERLKLMLTSKALYLKAKPFLYSNINIEFELLFYKNYTASNEQVQLIQTPKIFTLVIDLEKFFDVVIENIEFYYYYYNNNNKFDKEIKHENFFNIPLIHQLELANTIHILKIRHIKNCNNSDHSIIYKNFFNFLKDYENHWPDCCNNVSIKPLGIPLKYKYDARFISLDVGNI